MTARSTADVNEIRKTGKGKLQNIREAAEDVAPPKAANGKGEPAPRAIVPVRLSLDDVRSPPRETFAIGRTLPLEKVTVFFGPTGAGKSAALAQVLFAFAAGAEKLWGLPLLPGGGPVLVYTCEDTLDDWKRKAAAVHHAGGIDLARALERFYVIDKTDGVTRFSELVSVRSGTNLETVSRRVAQPTEEQELVIAAARSVGARVVAFETASRFVDDEDNASFSVLQSDLGRVARETGAAVALTHHATKAATRENDSAIESARGGGALVANARNALSLFPLEQQQASSYRDRFPLEDLFVLEHGKATSSTRRQASIVLLRTDAVHGAVFRLPDEVALSPEQERANAERLEQTRRRELEQLAKLYEVVERVLPTRPALSPSWLRDNARAELGVPKNGRGGVEALVSRAIDLGFLRVRTRTERGITLTLGVDPRKPVAEPQAARAKAGESTEIEA